MTRRTVYSDQSESIIFIERLCFRQPISWPKYIPKQVIPDDSASPSSSPIGKVNHLCKQSIITRKSYATADSIGLES